MRALGVVRIFIRETFHGNYYCFLEKYKPSFHLYKFKEKYEILYYSRSKLENVFCLNSLKSEVRGAEIAESDKL